MVQVIGMTAVFRKLKILCTSQQQNSNMCLRFSLYQFTSSGCEPCPGCVVTSEAIEVYSHPVYLSPGGSQYAQQQQQAILASHGIQSLAHRADSGLKRPLVLGDSNKTSSEEAHSTDVPVITEVVPSTASVGDKVVIVGSGFKDNSNLRVMFGSVSVEPEFNDCATLLCVVPEIAIENPKEPIVHVKVTNGDDSESSDAYAELRITSPVKQEETAVAATIVSV